MALPFDFIDLFAGIGGIRQGFESAGGRCVFTSEWDRFAQITYTANYDDEHPIAGDITQIDTADIPDHDVLLAGFPCQPFSIAGVSKKNSLGRPHGFADLTQGTLFFDVARVIAAKRPSAFLLENVKNLTRHDGGRTFSTIKTVLESELGYEIHTKVVNASPFVPQNRERILIAGFATGTSFSWDEFSAPEIHPKMASVLHSEDGSESPEGHFTLGEHAEVSDRYILSDHLWNYLQAYAEKHRRAGNGFGFGLVGPDDRARTLSARYHKDGSEILVSRGIGQNPRRLTPREAARLMGYSDDFVIPVSDTQAYRQFGNSVVVPVMKEAARIMAPHIGAVMGQATAA
ncbi:DNA (cytosine-5-)-methyltransferase [Agromyces neolithicus]|uniref:Cytosine-specific methyltransferase n=1 Tax=Agromyces neolithicus TaxID=269420 RepID=A0ABP4YF09_9MICO